MMYDGKVKQDTQRTYNVTMRCVHATIAGVQKQQLLHILRVFAVLHI